jgi:beta-lactamase regulating signal transducer with metallopeptidase domain
MNEDPHLLLAALLRTGLILTLSTLVLTGFLRLVKVTSPKVRRLAYFAVLVQGCLFVRGPFAIPLPQSLAEPLNRAPATVGWNQPARRAPAHTGRETIGAARKEKEVSGKERPPRRDHGLLSADELLVRADGLWPRELPAKPTASKHPGRPEGVPPGETWFKNEWDTSTSPEDGCHWRGLWLASASQFDDRSSPLSSETRQNIVGTSLPRQAQTLVSQPPGLAPEIRALELTAANLISPSDADFAPASSPRFPWVLALIAAWAAGIVLLVGRSACNYLRVVRQMPPVSEVDPEWSAEWLALQRQAGIRRNVPLAVAEHAGPVLFRLPRGYRLIVPGDAWRTLQSPQRVAILRHELAHIERRDVWKSLAMRVLALPHWFNPLAWHIVRRFDECAEWACDEAARRAFPEHVPDYARALLQLVDRAEPVFFATRAARAQGLSFRIRRLLTPAKEKGSTMKTAVMIALLSGISLANLTRLQTRADDGSTKAATLTVTATPLTAISVLPATTTAVSTTAVTTTAAATPATAAAPVAPVAAVTVVSAPVSAVAIAAPATSATPAAAPRTAATISVTAPASALPSSTVTIGSAAAALPAPVGVPAAAIATPAAVGVPANVAIAAPVALPAAALAPIDAQTPAATIAVQPPADPLAPRPPVAASRAQDNSVSFYVVTGPSQARADLGSILKNMREFQVKQEVLQADQLIWQQARAHRREAMVKAARQRIAAEKDPLIKDLLEKGIVQKTAELSNQVDPKLEERTKQLRDQMLAKVVAEIAQFAKERHVLVVRRADFGNPPSLYQPGSLLGILQNSDGTSYVDVTNQTGLKAQSVALNVTLSADPPAKAWEQEVLYVAGRDNQHDVDISNEIVKRLNAAYAASQTEGGKKSPQ